jgi:hypothetical protein
MLQQGILAKWTVPFQRLTVVVQRFPEAQRRPCCRPITQVSRNASAEECKRIICFQWDNRPYLGVSRDWGDRDGIDITDRPLAGVGTVNAAAFAEDWPLCWRDSFLTVFG